MKKHLIRFSVSTDQETAENFEEMTENLKKTKSAFFRDMVHFFYKQKEQIECGLRISEV